MLLRALQYATTHGYTVWLRPQDAYLSAGGVAASGPIASRLGLSGVPSSAETIALHTIIELVRVTGARVHLSHLSSAAGIELVRQAKREGLKLSSDVTVNHVHLTEMDIGYFDSQTRFGPTAANSARPRRDPRGFARRHHRCDLLRPHPRR